MKARGHRSLPILLTLALVLPAAVTLGAPARAEPPAAEAPAPPPLRAAAPPAAEELARLERWQRTWAAAAGPFEAAFARALDGIARPDAELRKRCGPLARTLLELDRTNLPPAPDPLADVHLKRGLSAATHAAIECLRGRPYAARGELRRAERSFARAARLLRHPVRRSERPADLAPRLHEPGAGGRENR